MLAPIAGAAGAAQEPAAEESAAAKAPAEPPPADGAPSETAPTDDAAERDEAVPRLPPVVVSARKIEELERDVPQSLTVISGEEIRDAGYTTVRDASFRVPNLNMTEFTSRRLSFPFLRGIGAGQGDPAVVTYIDGVPQLTVSSANIPLLDIDRIEFLRGPQGTLFGRNALAGVIHLVTKEPPRAAELRADVTLGNYDLQEYGLSWAGPLVPDEISLGISGLYSSRDGYTTNTVTGNDIDSREGWLGRGQLVFTPDDHNEVRIIGFGESDRDGSFALSFLPGLRSNPHTLAYDFEGVTERDIWSGAVTWEHDGESIDFTSVTAVQGWDILETTDFDYSPIDGIRRETIEDQTSVYQELRFASDETEDEAAAEGDVHLRWLAGASFFVADSDRASANDFRPGGAGILFPPVAVGVDEASGSFDDLGLALFGQATLVFGDLELGAGLRYDREEKDAEIDRTFTPFPGFTIPVSSGDFDATFDEWMPQFVLGLRLSEDARAHLSAARGFKAGGFNLTAPAGLESFGPETSWTYEAGIRTELFDDCLYLDVAAFIIDWSDLQLSQFSTATGGFVANAGEATSNGFEIDLVARPAEGIDLFTSFGYTDATFDQAVDAFGNNVSGNNLPFAPETTWSIGGQIVHPIGGGVSIFGRAEYAQLGRFFYDAGNIESERYGIATFRAGLDGGSWRLEAWIRNAFDEVYVPVAFQPNPADPTLFVGENGAPQTYGVTMRLLF